jgi:hypothetical protein
MKKGIWFIIVSALALAGCQSSRFMRDDMYFFSVDAIREVRQFEVARLEKQQAEVKKYTTDDNLHEPDISGIQLDNYYDYSYSARIRRFNDTNNTWAYYDPYFTNYYWFNPSSSKYFGQSVYSTYSWWGPNFGNNYNSDYWKTAPYRGNISLKGWVNPWKNNDTQSQWSNPFNALVSGGWNSALNNSSVSWNDYFCFDNMYYNSLDNNCYWWWSTQEVVNPSLKNNLAALMQKNEIRKDIIKRPDINYTAIRQSYVLALVHTQDTVDSNSVNNLVNENMENNQQLANNNLTKNSSNKSTTNTNQVLKTNTNTSTNTSKRWDNYKADVNIAPTDDSKNSWSRSGIFSEGSRNNNYIFNGSAIPKKKEVKKSKGSKQGKSKDPQ